MKNLILIITFFCAFQTLSAQNEAIYNHYNINPILVNPAATGFDENHKLHMNARMQWVGFEGNPQSYALTYNGAFGETFGIGGMIFSETIASLTRTRLQLDYAFRFKLPSTKLSIGFSTEWAQTRLPSSTYENPNIVQNFLIDDHIDGRSTFDASLGAFAKVKEKTTIGLSFPGLISSRIDDIAPGTQESSLFDYYTFMLGHVFDIDDMSFALEPSMMIRKVRNTPLTVDFNVLAKFLEGKITTGLSYRSGAGGAMGLLLGTKVSLVNIYYSYDVSFQRFQQYNSGSHEVTVGFEFGGKEVDRAAEYR